MTFGFVALLVAHGLGWVACAACFIWINRKKPELVDAADGVVRDFGQDKSR